MVSLPDDVTTDILTRLPVKSLLRFRCVSKPFCDLIDSRYFVEKHSNHSIKSKTNHKIILNGSSSFHVIDLYLPDRALVIEQPFKHDKFKSLIMGSVNGLLCIQTSIKDIVIWNLASKKYHQVSLLTVFQPIAYGFGYDSVSDDYKILCFGGIIFESTFGYSLDKYAVYSLRSETWKQFKTPPDHIRKYNSKLYGMLVCGALHWQVNKDGPDSSLRIVAFDLATNTFSLIAHPITLDKELNSSENNLSKISMSELGGNLCVICDYSWTRVDFWVMKNYRVQKSWMKLFCVSELDFSGFFWQDWHTLSYSQTGDEIMLRKGTNEFFWYNLQEKLMRKIEICDCSCSYFDTVICVESLVPPNGRWMD